jgi:DNA-directed RNA polymerase subunit RPC12/RpoP
MIAVENGTNKDYFHWCAKCRRNRMVEVKEDSSKISVTCTKCGHAVIEIPLFGNVDLKG